MKQYTKRRITKPIPKIDEDNPLGLTGLIDDFAIWRGLQQIRRSASMGHCRDAIYYIDNLLKSLENRMPEIPYTEKYRF